MSDNSFLYVKDIFGGDILVFMKPLCRICGFLTPEWLGTPQDNLFPDIIKVGSLKMSGYSPDFDKLGHWCLLFFFILPLCCVLQQHWS